MAGPDDKSFPMDDILIEAINGLEEDRSRIYEEVYGADATVFDHEYPEYVPSPEKKRLKRTKNVVPRSQRVFNERKTGRKINKRVVRNRPHIHIPKMDAEARYYMELNAKRRNTPSTDTFEDFMARMRNYPMPPPPMFPPPASEYLPLSREEVEAHCAEMKMAPPTFKEQ